MTTATLDIAPAAIEETTPATEETAKEETPTVDAEALLAEDRKFVRETSARGRTADVESKLAMAGRIARATRSLVTRFANSDETRKSVRSQACKLFAIDVTEGSGVATDDKTIYRWLKIDQLSSLLQSPNLTRLSWDAMRALAGWVAWNEKEDEYSLTFTVETHIPDANGRTTRTVDAGPLLQELVAALAASPKSYSSIRAIMLEKETEARKAEVSLLSSANQARARKVQEMAARQEKMQAQTALFDSFARRVVSLGMTEEEIVTRLHASAILSGTTADFAPEKMAEISADEATAVAKILLQAKNITAIVAMMKVMTPAMLEPSQPAKSTGATLGGVSREVHKAPSA